jgi:formylglycine-generating enzyme required for sulfatase activity
VEKNGRGGKGVPDGYNPLVALSILHIFGSLLMSARAWFRLVFLSNLVLLLGFVLPGWTEAPKGEKQPKEIENSIGMKLVLIPAGKFKMGSPKEEQDAVIMRAPEKFRKDVEGFVRAEGPLHDVEITKPFYLGVHEVTQKQFKIVMGNNPSFFSKDGKAVKSATYAPHTRPGGGKQQVNGMVTDDFPVDNVSWNEAIDFCTKLAALAKEKASGRVYRLPTEAEWEYACRGGASSSTPFHYGDSLSSTQANFNGNFPYGGADKGTDLHRSHTVGSYPKNAFGLYDLHGNVMEWCSDWYDADYYQNSDKKDPKGPEEGKLHVLRGGSWRGGASDCRSADRCGRSPSSRVYYYGFRVVSSLAKTPDGVAQCSRETRSSGICRARASAAWLGARSPTPSLGRTGRLRLSPA